jgi:hypothetical protein
LSAAPGKSKVGVMGSQIADRVNPRELETTLVQVHVKVDAEVRKSSLQASLGGRRLHLASAARFALALWSAAHWRTLMASGED